MVEGFVEILVSSKRALAIMVPACLALVGCATGTAGSSALPPDSLQVMAGTWVGEHWEAPASSQQGWERIAVTVSGDGTFEGAIGGKAVSGRLRFHDGLVVLEGDATANDGASHLHYCSVVAGSDVMWGVMLVTFKNMRAAPAMMRLGRIRTAE